MSDIRYPYHSPCESNSSAEVTDGYTFSVGRKGREYLEAEKGSGSGNGNGSQIEYCEEVDSDHRSSKPRSESGTLTMDVDDLASGEKGGGVSFLDMLVGWRGCEWRCPMSGVGRGAVGSWGLVGRRRGWERGVIL